MLKRIMAVLAAVALAVGMSAVPAQASVYNCPDGGWVCFWNYQSYNYQPDGHGGIYKFDLRYFYGDCQVMPTSGAAGWTNGKVYNAASSLLINNTGTNTLTNANVYFFDANNCSLSDYYFFVPIESGSLVGYPKLVNQGWNDRIGSFKIVNR